MYCHNLEVISSDSGKVELVVDSLSQSNTRCRGKPTVDRGWLIETKLVVVSNMYLNQQKYVGTGMIHDHTL